VAALAQQAAATAAPKALSGLNFAFDAPHGQLTASGYTVKATPNASGSTSQHSETIEVNLTINLVTKFAKGIELPCSALVIGGEVDATNWVVAGGVETVSGWATVSSSTPSTATCKLTIPFEWTLQEDPSASFGLVIAYGAGAVTRDGKTLRSTLQVAGFHDLHNNATTKYEFSVTL
jgi:hypothetical protein